jgi:hypothetical protein
VFGHDARQRHGQIVAQREVCLACLLVLAPLEDFEDELIALFAVLPQQRLDVLDRRGLQRLKPVALVHPLDDADDILAPANIRGEKVAHPARRLCLASCHYLKMEKPA